MTVEELCQKMYTHTHTHIYIYKLDKIDYGLTRVMWGLLTLNEQRYHAVFEDDML